MPHDTNGQIVANGDVVTLLASVSHVSLAEKYCNCTFTVLVPAEIKGEYAPSFVGNTRLSALLPKGYKPRTRPFVVGDLVYHQSPGSARYGTVGKILIDGYTHVNIKVLARFWDILAKDSNTNANLSIGGNDVINAIPVEEVQLLCGVGW